MDNNEELERGFFITKYQKEYELADRKWARAYDDQFTLDANLAKARHAAESNAKARDEWKTKRDQLEVLVRLLGGDVNE